MAKRESQPTAVNTTSRFYRIRAAAGTSKRFELCQVIIEPGKAPIETPVTGRLTLNECLMRGMRCLQVGPRETAEFWAEYMAANEVEHE